MSTSVGAIPICRHFCNNLQGYDLNGRSCGINLRIPWGFKAMKEYLSETAIKIMIILIVIIFSLSFIKYILRESESENDYLNNINIGNHMELIFFGLGDADSVLIRQGDKTLLIDTGEKHDGAYIVNSLLNLGVDKIDYLILTHPDKDHIGGAVDIIHTFEVGVIFQSAFQKGKETQQILNNMITKNEIETLIIDKPYEVSLGQVLVTIFPPDKDYYKKSNDYSLMTLLTHGELNLFFGGDAEKKRLEEVLEYDLPKVTLYKVPHHGRGNSKSAHIIEKLSPKVAIITNYSADREVLEALELQNTKVYYTSDKSIRFISDGVELIEP